MKEILRDFMAYCLLIAIVGIYIGAIELLFANISPQTDIAQFGIRAFCFPLMTFACIYGILSLAVWWAFPKGRNT